MKILHTSDVHIDSPLTARLSADKIKERRGELRSGFRRLVSEARSQGASAVIIAGDLFDSSRVSRRAVSSVLDTVREEPSLTFLYLEGNHEGEALREAGVKIPENLLFFGSDWTYYVADGVCFAGRGEISENMFDTLSLPSDTKNIVVLHGALGDGRGGEVIGIRDAKDRGIDYLALGHYHSHSAVKIDGRCVAVYSGTPEGRGFDETGDKGYVLVDTDGEGISYTFKPFAKRRLHIAEVDITDAESTLEIEERARAVLRDIPSSDLVRLLLCGSFRPELWKDTEGLRRSLGGSFYYFEVKDSSKPLIDPDSYKNDKSLKGEFIRTVMADESLDGETKAKIISCGINALMGEELFGG